MGYLDEYKDSVHVGEIKQRIELDVKVKKVFRKENEFGVTNIVHMVDTDGNYFVWFASNGGLIQGEEYKVKATVKKHSEYEGIKQTIVNRVTPIK